MSLVTNRDPFFLFFNSGWAQEVGAFPIDTGLGPVSVTFPLVVRSRSRMSRAGSFFAPTSIVVPPPFVPNPFFPVLQTKNVARARGPTTSARRPSWFGPVNKPFIPVVGAILFQHQRVLIARRRTHLRPAYFGPSRLIANPTVTPIGPTTVATLAIDFESGSRVTYGWKTIVRKMWSGLETRASTRRRPRQSFDFSSVLDVGRFREVISVLAGNANDALPFLLGLSHEDLTITASDTVSVSVASTAAALSDWIVIGQRIVVSSLDGDVTNTYITSVTTSGSNTIIGTAANVSSFADVGGRVMPAVAIFLEENQQISRQIVNAGTWKLAARTPEVVYGPPATAVVGNGATIPTYDGFPVWDRGVGATGAAAQPIYTGTQELDLGGYVDATAQYTHPDWGRSFRFASDSLADWQHLKKFLDTVRGKAVAFLLPTGRPDLIATSDASSGTLTVEGPPTALAPNYTTHWFPSAAHRRLRITLASGTTAYRTVSSCVDNGNGTQNLVLDSALAGAISTIEFLETVRLDSDDVSVSWHGHMFECDLTARVVQR